MTRIITTLRFPRPRRCCRYGQASEPIIAKIGAIIPMNISEEAGINRTVLAKRTAVEVIVVKPGMGVVNGYSQRNLTK